VCVISALSNLTFTTSGHILGIRMSRQRLDSLMVQRSLAPTREKARALIMAGVVLFQGKVVDKPGTMVPEEAELRLVEQPLFVSRGGVKLAHALDQLGIDVSLLAALDIGASTGGFTDCLLQRGTRRVYAVDVGYGQIDYRLRTDSRVVVMERVNARYPFDLPEPVDLVVADVSFISLEMVLPNAVTWLKPGGAIVALVKPQFEAGREQVGKGGVVRDPRVHAQVLGRFVSWTLSQGLRFGGLVASPITGAEGNREFLVLLRKGTE